MPIPKKNTNETNDEFIGRCMADEVMQEYDDKQRLAICESQIQGRVSFDYDGTLTSTDGLNKLNIELKSKNEIFIISARKENKELLKFAKDNNIKAANVFAVGSIEEKLKKIKELKINKHYDNDSDVIESLSGVGILVIENKKAMTNKRHVKEIIEDKETITMVYEKDEEFEGIKVKEDDRPDEGDEETIEENDLHLEDEIEEEDEGEEIEDEIEEEEEESLTKKDRKIWKSSETREKRFYTIETRIKKEGKKNVIEGHAAVYDMLSEDLGGFREIIKKGAFDSVLTNDVRAYFNHDPNYILGRTGAGTLKLSTTEKGLKYILSVPDTSAGRDLVVSMKRGDITQSSFAFQVEKDSWRTDNSLGEIRTIESVKRLYDVSPVSLPAYPDADDIAVAQRGYYVHKDKQKIEKENNYEIKRSLLKLKINILKRK